MHEFAVEEDWEGWENWETAHPNAVADFQQDVSLRRRTLVESAASDEHSCTTETRSETRCYRVYYQRRRLVPTLCSTGNVHESLQCEGPVLEGLLVPGVPVHNGLFLELLSGRRGQQRLTGDILPPVGLECRI